ncbi:MAG: LysE family translocator [Campylobacter sp.]
MESFIKGALFGYGASIPIGPVNILIVAYALRSFKLGFAIGAGAMLTDAIYLLLSDLGVSVFLKQNALFMEILSIFGASFLFYIAFITARGANKILEFNVASKQSLMRCFLQGVWVNALNPFIIAFWISVSAFTNSVQNQFLSLAGLIFSITTLIIFLPLIVAKSRKIISPKVAAVFAYVSAMFLAVFALLIIYEQFFKG